MRKIYLLLSAVICSASLLGQTTDLGNPISWNGKLDDNIALEKMSNVDVNVLNAEDALIDHLKDRPWRFGYKHNVNLNLSNSGSWSVLPNGDKIWRLKISCPDAMSINLVMDQFKMPQGGFLYLYSQDRENVIGAYTFDNNNDENVFGTELLLGDNMILEYYEPISVAGQGQLSIESVVHGYRSATEYAENMYKALNSSGDCNVDADCPLGNNWEDQKNSVAMLVSGGNGFCTGALVNNTANDGTPYFLTANHCYNGNPGSVNSWVFRFNWKSTVPSCATTAGSVDPGAPYDEVNGSTFRANNSGSDFLLVELNSVPPASYGVYYAGWDNSGATPTQVTGIHHPSGDVMKICQDNGPITAISMNFNGDPNTMMWRIADWDQGVTEPGSSGSAIFDQNGRVVGQLAGGYAACNGTNDNGTEDWYGRLDVSWDGANSAERLRDWLDPSNNTSVIDGFDPNAPAVANDAGLTSVSEPTGNHCNVASFDPIVVLRNYGSNTLTSVDIVYDLNGGASSTYNWTGSLASGATANVTLPTITAAGGNNTFTAATTNPNGNVDNGPGNDDASSTFFVVANGVTIDLEINPDCWASELDWAVEDNGTVLYSGSGYSDGSQGTPINESFCLSEGQCYDFVINDSYGDGMYGSQYNSCSVDGTYYIKDDQGNIIDSIQAANSDYGNQEINNFCVPSQSLTANMYVSNTTICAGSSVDFTDNSSGSPITWSWNFTGASNSSSTSQNPTGVTYNNPGTYDVQLTVGDGSTTDSQTFTSTITVVANPTSAIVNSSNVSCNGGNDGSGEVSASAGTPNYSFSWAPSGGNSAAASGLSAGSYTVTITDANNCTTTQSVVITEPTALSVNQPSVINASCGMQDGQVSVSVAGGTPSYSYALNGGAQQSSATFSGLGVGTYSIDIIDANGCQENVSATVTNPNAPSANISATDEDCAGDCDGEATATITGGTAPYTVNWDNSMSGTTISGLCAGSYIATVVDANNCQTTQTVTIGSTSQVPVASASPSTTTLDIAVNGDVTFTDNSSNASSYDWDFGDSNTSNQSSPTHTYTQAGTYMVTLTVTNGNCTDQTTFTINVVNSVGLEENLLSNINIYPNPANNQLRIEFDSNESGKGSISILDMSGKIVLINNLSVFGNNSVNLNISSLANGLYLVRIKTENGQSLSKLVIE